MPLNIIFFIGSLSFLSGIVYASIGINIFFILDFSLALFIVLIFLKSGLKIAVLATVLLLLGGLYYFWDDFNYQKLLARVPLTNVNITGILSAPPSFENGSQKLTVNTVLGKVLVETSSGSDFNYGDKISISGRIRPAPDIGYGKYLAKEKIIGTIFQPQISILSSGNGNRFFSFFYRLKDSINQSYNSLFTPDQAALISGVTLGINHNFSKKFAENLSLSGMRHLTSISGLHMSIVVFVVFSALLFFMPRLSAFILTFLTVSFFTALTGFSISAIRSAILAFIVGLSKLVGRVYSPRNSIALAASVLAIANPKIIVYDTSFQLSFIAVLSIIYFKPVLARFLHIEDTGGFFNWKETLLITLAAQIGVAPILISQFQNFSPTSLIGNILVLSFIPYLLIFSYLTSIFYFIFTPLAKVMALIVAPLAQYVILIINLSAHFAVLFNPNLGYSGIALYYAVFLYLTIRFYVPVK